MQDNLLEYSWIATGVVLALLARYDTLESVFALLAQKILSTGTIDKGAVRCVKFSRSAKASCL